MDSNQIREAFLSFFESKGHKRLKSSSLIPQDPTLFFTNAGMVQFKQIFTGEEKVDYKRATTSQKCMRVSGKHNDLENVGYTLRHHTLFEMLGNFSFGDYFKQDAILFAWEFLTQVLKISKEKLYVSVFRDDDEAEALWIKLTGIEKKRIYRFGEKDNFWSMGDTGPCGPCSEIFYDHGAEHGCGKATCEVGCDCDRFMEIWNLVFMQYNRGSDGKMESLPKPSVDTGMGLERLACVVQGKHSNYDSDLFTDVFAAIEKISGKKYGSSEAVSVAMRVLADHLRATAFLIGEGVVPANEGRGYVLRRIMRRAIRYGKKLGFTEPFFYQLVDALVKKMGAVYLELQHNQTFIEEVIRAEEQRFFTTLEKGLGYLEQAITEAKNKKIKTISGKIAFALYDTFGFPLDLTQLIASEQGMEVDQNEFDKNMGEQRERARAAWKGSGEEKLSEIYLTLAAKGLKSKFLGYETTDAKGKILIILKDGQEVDQAQQGDSVEILCDQTPFYAESGGQVGDHGVITTASATVEITDTHAPKPGLILHQAKIKSGIIKLGDDVLLQVQNVSRFKTMANHSATHLMHAALRKVLGDHVKQAGSLVNENYLRFDFSHFSAMTPQQLETVERLVNQKIRENILVKKEVKSYQEAVTTGAMALFGEKYGDEVRVLTMGDFSVELCGGTHVNYTGDIAYFKITSESSVAAGVRRIEGLTGEAAYDYSKKMEQQILALISELKSKPEELTEKIKKINLQIKKYEKEISDLKAKVATGAGSGDDPLKEVQEIKGVRVLVLRRDLDDMKALRHLSDQLKAKLGSGILVLTSGVDGKATIIVAVSKDLVEKYYAGEICKKLAACVGGSGGGRPDMAQAGGPNIAGLDQVFATLTTVL